MRDLEHQSAEAPAYPVSELTRRLLRRAIDPVGVIDTRQAVELHSRSRLLPTQRLELLNDLNTRYGVEHSDGTATPSDSTAGSLLLPSPWQKLGSANSFELGSAPPWGSRTAPSEAEQTSTPGASTTVQYRVKRPGTRVESGSAEQRTTEVAAETSAASSSKNVVSVLPAFPAQQEREPIQPLARSTADSPAPSSLNFDDASTREGARSASAVSQAVELPRVDVVPQMRLRRKAKSPSAGEPRMLRQDLHDEQPTAGADNLPRVSELSRAVVAPMRLQRMPAVAPLAVDTVAAPSTREELSSGHVVSPGAAPVSGLHWQAKADPLTATGSRNATTIGDSSLAGVGSRSRAVVSAEISARPPAPGSTNIVWRKAETGTSGLGQAAPQASSVGGPPYGSVPGTVLRSASELSNRDTVSTLSLPSPGNDRIDITHVAEQVSRIMARQLRIERERRGRTR
jgi:hypothetical protein